MRTSPLASPSHVSVSAVPSTVAVIPGDALYAARLQARGSADAVADMLSNTATHAVRIPVREIDFICRSVYPSFQQRTSHPSASKRTASRIDLIWRGGSVDYSPACAASCRKLSHWAAIHLIGTASVTNSGWRTDLRASACTRRRARCG